MQDLDKMQKKHRNIGQSSLIGFETLIESIKRATNLNEEQISLRLKYNEGYISQTRSRGKASEKLINSLLREFRNELSAEKHITTRNNFKKIGEEKSGIQVYETAPTYATIKTVYHDEHAVPDYVLNIPQFRDCNYGTRASGDSMYPEIRNGDLIVCKELPIDARIIYGDIYIIHTKDGIETIKYCQQFIDSDKNEPWVLLVPHNKAAGMGTPIPRKEIIKLFKVRAIFKAY